MKVKISISKQEVDVGKMNMADIQQLVDLLITAGFEYNLKVIKK